MLRLLGFFLVVFMATGLLAQIPFLGGIFRIPLLGFWITAILLSAVVAKAGTVAVDAQKRRALVRSLGAVDTPHHKGKLAGLLLSQGRPQRALPLFEQAAAGDPDSLEFRYRLSQCRLEGPRDYGGALEDLAHVLARDEEFRYGAAMLLSARAAHGLGRGEEALARLDRFERNHGPEPASALLRGQVLKSMGRGPEAEAAFGEVAALAAASGRKNGGAPWVWEMRARLARWFGSGV